MRKVIIAAVITAVLVSMSPIAFADANPISILVDGSVITIPDGEPYVNSDGRTMVPVRFVSENLGCQVDWNSGVVSIHNKAVKIALKIGEYKAQVTNLSTNVTRLAVFDTKAVLKGGRTMVPVRFISETLDAKVDWNGTAKQVVILSSGNYTKTPQPEYYNRMYAIGGTKKIPYNLDVPFDIEYNRTTKNEIENTPILKAFSQLPNCTYVCKDVSPASEETIYRFVYEDINMKGYNNLNSIYSIRYYPNTTGLAFWIDRNCALTLGLFRNTLALLYKDKPSLQDAVYKQALNQKKASSYIQNSFNNYCIFTNNTGPACWGEEDFRVWGTVDKEK